MTRRKKVLGGLAIEYLGIFNRTLRLREKSKKAENKKSKEGSNPWLTIYTFCIGYIKCIKQRIQINFTLVENYNLFLNTL